MTEIRDAIIHKLLKEKQGPATVQLRENDLPITDPVKTLVDDIFKMYGAKASKGFGRFEPDEITFPVAAQLRNHLAGRLTFRELSNSLMNVLADRAGKAQMATGGYVLMAMVTNEAATPFFIVAIITHVSGSAIDPDTLEVRDTVHVDVENLRVAGRVNVNDWLGGEVNVRYVGFLKQRGDVAEYFKQFLGCNEILRSLDETKKLVGVLQKFAKDKNLQDDEEQALLDEAYAFAMHCNLTKKLLSLNELANHLWPAEPEELLSAMTHVDAHLSDGFVPDARPLSALVRIRAKTAYWKLDLQKSALTEGFAKYNKDKKELVLKNLPKSLLDELEGGDGDG